MRYQSGFILGACSAALMFTSLLATLEVTTATARPEENVSGVTVVNRTLKGNRMPAAASRATPVRIEHGTKLPDGCEPIVSSITRSPLTQIPASCVS